MHYLSRKKQFWVCQIVGWSMLATANLLLRLMPDFNNVGEQIANSLVLLLFGLLTSLGLRVFYIKSRMIEKSLSRMVLPVLICSLISTSAMALFMLGTISLLHSTNPDYDSALGHMNIISNIIGLYPITLIWSCIYIGVQSLQRWKQVESEKLSLQLALKEAQLNTLIGQINPHFMFNSLNNIRALMLEDINQARASITQLSNVMRHALSADKKSHIPLEQELKVIEEFIAISGIQYEGRLKFKSKVDDHLLHVLVPPMMIQMLIENAIKHGISLVKGGGVLSLEINKQADFIFIQVCNPGSLKPSSTSSTSTNIGLHNIRKRLQLLYGSSASLELSEADETVIATLTFPIQSHRSKAEL